MNDLRVGHVVRVAGYGSQQWKITQVDKKGKNVTLTMQQIGQPLFMGVNPANTKVTRVTK